MSYNFCKQDLLDFVQANRFSTVQKGEELFFAACPYCGGGAHKDKDTFSVNVNNGTFNCFRAGCGKKGHFAELARDFRFRLDFQNDRKAYRKLPQKPITVRPEALAYLKSRGISEAVAQIYQITVKQNEPHILVFPFFDENGILQSVKYRNTRYEKGKGAKEWAEKDTKRILFGMNRTQGFDRLIITEGQLDSLSVAEAGILNAVSVPNGAMGFTWIAACWEWIIQFREIVVFGDCENGKISLLEELQRRLPQTVKAVRQADYLGEKDANDILLKYGADAVRRAVENAEVPEMPNVKRLCDVKTVDIYKLPGIFTGIGEIDKVIQKMFFGQVILLTGKRGGGKSTVLSQIGANALEQGFPTFFYSGELTDYHFKRWLDFQLAGPNHLIASPDGFGGEVYGIAKEAAEKISAWYQNSAFIYDNSYLPQDRELELLPRTVEQAVRRYGIKLVCIDNLMTALEANTQKDLYLAQSAFVGRMKRLAVQQDCVVLLVAHPRKEAGGDYNDAVSGSADITNKVDVVLRYDRTEDGEDFDGRLKITKNRLLGKLTGKKDIELYYSRSTKRITDINSGITRYGWENLKSADKTVTECPF